MLDIYHDSKAGNRLHYLGQLAKENAAETLVVALLSQISDLDEERVMTIDRRLSQVSLFYEVIHEQVQHGYRRPSRRSCRHILDETLPPEVTLFELAAEVSLV
jgi:hypothetical protein